MVSAAFIPLTPVLSRSHVSVAKTSRAVAPRMSVSRMRRAATRLAAIPATLAATLPAVASEGTGEGLGIDNGLLYLPLILIPAVFFAFFIQFARQQDNSDFFGGYDERRN